MRGKNLKTTGNFRKIMSLLIVLVMLVTYIPTTLVTSVYAAAGAGDGQIEYIGGENSVSQSSGAPFDITVSKTIEAVEGKENYFDITLRTKTRRQSINEETDVVFVVDISNTMNADEENDYSDNPDDYDESTSRINQAKKAINKFVEEYATNTKLDEDREVGIVTFNTNANVTLPLTECNDEIDAENIYSVVDGITAPKGEDDANKGERFTNIEGGLQIALNILKESSAAYKYIILLTDGFPTTYVKGYEGDNKIIGYDPYMTGKTYDSSWETTPGRFAYTLGEGVKICELGTSYSNRAALRSEAVAETIKSSGINIFSVGFDIGVQSVDKYLEACEGETYSIVDTTGMSKDEEFAIGRTAESYQAWLEDKIAGGVLLDAMDEKAHTFSHGRDLATLTQAFQTILGDIEKVPEAVMRGFYTLDPMSDKVEFMYFFDMYGNPVVDTNTLVGESKKGAENTASYDAEGHKDEIYWDLLNSGYTTETDKDGTEWLVFDITYRVRLENEYFTIDEWEKAFETNNRIEDGTKKTTALHYKSTIENGTLIPEKSGEVEYPVPWVEGYDGELKFRKVDETGKALEGARFKLQHNGNSCSVCKGDANIDDIIKVSGSDGMVEFTEIPSGHEYILVEIEAPYGYEIGNSTVVIISYGETYIGAKSDQTKLVDGKINGEEFVITDTKIRGSVKVVKVGEENNPLEGAEFAIYKKSDVDFENPIEIKTTDANGELIFESYEYGDYVVRETKAPEGYNLEGVENALGKEVSITENLKVYELEYSNTKIRGSIKVVKVGEENDPLEGAEFTIYNKSDVDFENPLETKVTDANGEVIFENYEYGDYVVKETKAPEGYNLEGVENALSKDVSITENLKVYEVKYLNTKIRGSVKVVKVGEENNLLEGAEFTIYNKSDVDFKNPIETKTTDANGQAVFENLEYGDYVVRETKAPEGYNLEVVGDETSQNREVSITENLKVYELEYSNTKIRGSIEITKFGENADTLEGVEFTLYEKADSEFKNPILVAITDANGVAKFENVQYGEYVIKETKAKAGYNNSDKTVEINVSENEKLYKATFENTKIRGSIEVIKKDDKGRLVSGTEFTLYSYDDVNFENPLQPPALTDENGRVKFENVEYGRYIVKETKAAEGYLISEIDTRVVIVTENGVNYISEFTDEIKKGDIVITKVSEDGTLLSDVEFTLYSNDDINFENPLEMVITGDDGLAIFRNVEYGKYKIKETRAKEGYNLSTEVLEVNVNEHGKIYDFEVINTKIIGEILGTKISNVTKLPLEGAEFALYSINDKEFKYPLGFSISDENGKISFKNVEYGSYLLKEIKAPEGYYLMKEAIEVNIIEHGAIYEFEIENQKIEDSIVSSDNNSNDSNDTIINEILPNTGEVITTGIKLAVAISVIVVGAILLKKKKQN